MPPWDAVSDLLLYAILPAFLTAAAVTGAVAFFGGARQARTGAALGLIAGVALGFWLKHTLPLVPGDSTWNRLPWAALIALVVGRVAHLADEQSNDGWTLRAGAALGIAWLVVPDNIRSEFGWITFAFGFVIFGNWRVLESLGDQPASESIGICAILALLVAGGVLVFAGIARYMEGAIIIAMALAGVTLIAWWRKFDLGGVMPAIAVALPGLLLIGNRETSVESIHWAAFALPAFAPLFLASTLPLRNWSPGKLYVFRVTLVLIPLVIAMLLAQQGGSLDFGDPDW